MKFDETGVNKQAPKVTPGASLSILDSDSTHYSTEVKVKLHLLKS